jgi:hypothetical protein
MSRSATLSALAAAAVCAALFAALPVTRAAPAALLIEPDEAEAQLARAARESRRAQSRAARLTREAEAATEAATRTAREAAALAARIQQAEADIEVARARHAIVRGERAALTARLAEKQEPTARLAAALQTAARRPLALSALQPGSLKEVVYMRAVLDSAVPQIRARTAGLRADERGQRLVATAEARGISVVDVSDAELESAADTDTPQGVLAVATIPDQPLAVPTGPARYLVLDALQEPGNVGAVVRTAAAMGVTATSALPGTVDMWNAKVVRSSMGALFHHPVAMRSWELILSRFFAPA